MWSIKRDCVRPKVDKGALRRLKRERKQIMIPDDRRNLPVASFPLTPQACPPEFRPVRWGDHRAYIANSPPDIGERVNRAGIAVGAAARHREHSQIACAVIAELKALGGHRQLPWASRAATAGGQKKVLWKRTGITEVRRR